MKHRRISIVGMIGLSVGLLAMIAWLCFGQVDTSGINGLMEPEPEPFIPSESISPNQVVAFPTDI